LLCTLLYLLFFHSFQRSVCEDDRSEVSHCATFQVPRLLEGDLETVPPSANGGAGTCLCVVSGAGGTLFPGDCGNPAGGLPVQGGDLFPLPRLLQSPLGEPNLPDRQVPEAVSREFKGQRPR